MKVYRVSLPSLPSLPHLRARLSIALVVATGLLAQYGCDGLAEADPDLAARTPTAARQALLTASSAREIYRGLAAALVQDDAYYFVGIAADEMAGTPGGLLRIERADTSKQLVLSEQGQYPVGLALDTTDVYVADMFAGTVARLPKTGGAPRVLVSGLDAPSSVFVDAKNVYFTTASAVRRVPKGGGAITTIATRQDSPGDVVADGKYVFWSTYTSVVRAPLAGGPSVVIARASGAVPGIAIDTSTVYFIDNPAYGLTGVVKSIPKVGGKVSVVASEQAIPMDLAVDGTNVYWANSALADLYTDAGSVVRWSKGAASPVTVADAQWAPMVVSARGGNVAWIAQGEDMIPTVLVLE